MAETATIVGGLLVSLALDPKEFSAAQAALIAAGKGFTEGEVHSDMSQKPDPNSLNVYNINAVSGAVYTQRAGEQVIALQGSASSTIVGLANAKGDLLIGNSGDDTIKTTGGTGTIFLGDGQNTVSVTGGTQSITTGAASSKDRIIMTGGHVVLSGSAADTVYVKGGSDTISTTGTVQISASGSDTITLGLGNDTISATGSATVTGSGGSLLFRGGVNSVVYAGAGSETLYGGTGSTSFYGGAYVRERDEMIGRGGTNLFQGGKGRDTMFSGASKGATSDTFQFSSTVAGGKHIINGYTNGKDHIDLQGYSKSDVTITHVGANTVIKLEDNTVITVRNADITLNQIKFT